MKRPAIKSVEVTGRFYTVVLEDGTVYHVYEKNGVYHCDCMAGTFKEMGCKLKECRHVRACREKRHEAVEAYHDHLSSDFD